MTTGSTQPQQPADRSGKADQPSEARNQQREQRQPLQSDPHQLLRVPQLLQTAAMAEVESRDSRSSSSTNSPAPVDNEESDFYPLANDSESSLGAVPNNMQDMQVNDPVCLSIAATLPSEILISIFAHLGSPSQMLKCMKVSKRWARNVVEMLWHRPTCASWDKHTLICQTLGLEHPMFSYRDFIKRLNLSTLAQNVNDGSVTPLAVCTRVERLTLTSCKDLTDTGLVALVSNSPHLLALDISQDVKITENSIIAIAQNCPRLQGLNISNCKAISNESLIQLAENCRYIKRLKLNDCDQLTDNAVLAFANNCPNILEIDLFSCASIGNEPVTALLARGQSLRELRLANCDLISDNAFLSLPSNRYYDHLRILDLTSCTGLTDRAVEKIIDVAPRLRNLVLAKCNNITDVAVYSIARLGKNLHYVHLGHCRNITDDAVKKLVQSCNRIRYIDLGCCTHLTDESVMKLATLPKLKRIGLVKCSAITDESMYALARANSRGRARRDAAGNIVHDHHHPSSLERVHLSYCTQLTLASIVRLLNSCPNLTHLSLTGVPAFLREDFENFCRDAPADFTEHQRQVFCVFSGNGVMGLRRYLNDNDEFLEYHELRDDRRMRAATMPGPAMGSVAMVPTATADMDGFDEADVVEDDDMGDGSEIALDTGNDDAPAMPAGGMNLVPPPPPPAPDLFSAPGGSRPAAVILGTPSPVQNGSPAPTQISLDQGIAVHPASHDQANASFPGGNGPSTGHSSASARSQSASGDGQAG